jgi:DNA-binding XRE family transcriptional regulator
MARPAPRYYGWIHAKETSEMTFDEYKAKKMENPDFKRAYDELGPEYEIIKALIEARKEKNLTQKQLAEMTGIQQAHISKLETGSYNPSLKFLKRIAKGLDKELHITFK